MHIDVYDTHVTTEQGKYLHFDILVEKDNAENIKDYAKNWLESMGHSAQDFDQSRCNYCHSEIAKQEVIDMIKQEKFYVICLEGCE
jgi:hypothetical protein